jgi:ribosomal protein L24
LCGLSIVTMSVWVKDDAVAVIKGKYKGRVGMVVKVTAQMMVVKLEDTLEEVRILQSSVVSNEARKELSLERLTVIEPGAEVKSLLLVKAKKELKALKERLDDVIKLIEYLEIR